MMVVVLLAVAEVVVWVNVMEIVGVESAVTDEE
jgi:hypothetical protein